MKKTIIKTSDNIVVLGAGMGLFTTEEVILGPNNTVRMEMFIEDLQGNEPHIVWTLSDKLLLAGYSLRGVVGKEFLINGPEKPAKLKVGTLLATGRIYEPSLLHRITTDTTASGARIL